MAQSHLTDEQLSAHIDGDLAGDAVGITDHLGSCDGCANRLQLLRATSQAVAGLPEEELPRPLDLAFLRAAPRGFIASIIHGRPPTWVPTAVAVAAVLALAITWAPRLLPATGGQSTATAGRGPASRAAASAAPLTNLAPGPADQTKSGAGAAPSGNAFAPPAAIAPGAAQKTVTGPDGSTVAILANPTSATTGHPIQLLLRLVGGPHGTTLAQPGMEIFVGQGQSQLREAGSEGTSRTLKAGEELDLTVEWSAGALAGPPAPGTYSLIGRVFLGSGKPVEVSLTYTVSG